MFRFKKKKNLKNPSRPVYTGLCNVRVKLVAPPSVKRFQRAWNSAGQCTPQANWHTSVALGFEMLSSLLGSGLVPA